MGHIQIKAVVRAAAHRGVSVMSKDTTGISPTNLLFCRQLFDHVHVHVIYVVCIHPPSYMSFKLHLQMQ